ncbi:hypothetical protein BDD43_1032 [Mucilaginibacter gracilis]|uniref:TonB-like protein n=1 Tax=Mucilaginibacter gracilis TaxID=423350 RepID=A0A495IVW5_9SPHI|nr:hypothetical protein [Mucilaginibacter gracilis]RKR80895.1 hypothetical protein BDD43_1032 [Mucilaginibacter gracilis]
MKKTLILALVVLMCGTAFAQKKEKAAADTVKKELPAPFKGGIDSLLQFFKDNLVVSPQIIKAKASGTAIIKFTSEGKGFLTSIVIYYADDYMLTQPATDVLRRSNGKWIIPKEVQLYDFVIQFTYNYKPTGGDIKPAALKAILDYQQQHKPIISTNQVPLNYATMLPTIVVNYE